MAATVDNPVLTYRVVLANGDEAEAENLEGACLAARTLWDEATWVDCRPAVHVYLIGPGGETHLVTVSDRSQL